MKIIKYLLVIVFIVTIMFVLSFSNNDGNEIFFHNGRMTMEQRVAKPVIYLYPKKRTKIRVKLDCEGKLFCTYPQYNDGWEVTAEPNGTLHDSEDKEYSYLFWEAISDYKWNIKEGFVIKGSHTAEFLEKSLKELGLTPREYNEFIVYWLPKMQENEYNLIHFAGKEYEKLAKLSIKPKPDNILRVFMVYKPLENPIEIKPQILKKGSVQITGSEIRPNYV